MRKWRWGRGGGVELADVFRLSKSAYRGMLRYMDLVLPRELEAARAKFAQ